MYKNRSKQGTANISGTNIASLRKSILPKLSQRAFAELLQLAGLDVDKNAIQRIECGKRFVTDIELKTIASVLGVSTDTLLEEPKNE